MKQALLILAITLLAVAGIAAAAPQTAAPEAAVPQMVASVFESPVEPTGESKLDKLVFAELARLNIHPVLCSDAVFIRRAYLDVIGTLPTAAQVQNFIKDPDTKNKRRLLIDQLLEQPEFADYWAMRWGDILRIKAEFPVNLWPNAAQAYHHWVHTSIAENKPYDKFVRELLTSSGSNFRVGPVNFYRAIQNRTPQGIAAAVALAFMGTRVDAWPADTLDGLSAFFSQVGYKPTSEWKEENVFWDPLGASTIASNIAPGRAAIVTPEPSAKDKEKDKDKDKDKDKEKTKDTTAAALPSSTAPQEAVFPNGKKIKLPQNKDPREIFADWLISPKNQWFTRAIANRIWYWLMGRGIIHEPDDIRPDNPPSNPALLAYLEKELIASHYDLKRLYRLILSSETYQLSSIQRFKVPNAEAKFAGYPLRRLDAEVLIDAINKITGATDLYTSPIPEPFTYIPDSKPAIDLPDGSITSPFLALFGRSARATGMENERNNKPIPSQWLHLLNSSHIQRKLDQGPRLKALFESGRKPQEIVEELYLTILSRFPTPEEINNALSYSSVKPAAPKTAAPKTAAPAAAPAKRREDWVDIAWSLINSIEFLYRH
jgi:hypothetical protein